MGSLGTTPTQLADQAGISVSVQRGDSAGIRTISNSPIESAVRFATGSDLLQSSEINNVFIDANGNAFRLDAIDADRLGGTFTAVSGSFVATGTLVSATLDVARTESAEVGGLAAQKVKVANTNAIVGDWLTQVANGKVVRLTDGTATFLVSSFDATEQTITLIPADGVSSVIAPTSLTYGIDQGYVRLPLILGSLTVDSASPLQPRTFELTDPSLVDADGGCVVELAIGADGLVTNVVSSRVLGTIENGLLSGTTLSAGVDSGAILDGASGSFFDKTGVSYYALAENGKAAASDSWMSMAITVTPSTVTDASSLQVWMRMA